MLALYNQWVKAEIEARRINAEYDGVMGRTYKISDLLEKAAAQDLVRRSDLASKNEEACEKTHEIADRVSQMDPVTFAGIAAYLRAGFWLMLDDPAKPGDEAAALTVIEACERMAGRALS